MTRIPAGAPAMWLASTAGMALGLAIDCRSVSPEALAGLCSAGNGALLAGFLRHLAMLPATNLGMLLGGFLALGFARLKNPLINLACSALMLIGMSLAVCAGPAFFACFGVSWNATIMLAVMTLGMSMGMAAVAILGRLANRAPAFFPLSAL